MRVTNIYGVTGYPTDVLHTWLDFKGSIQTEKNPGAMQTYYRCTKCGAVTQKKHLDDCRGYHLFPQTDVKYNPGDQVAVWNATKFGTVVDQARDDQGYPIRVCESYVVKLFDDRQVIVAAIAMQHRITNYPIEESV